MARPKSLRFLLFNTLGRLVHHARRTVDGGSWEGLQLLPVSP
jgi:hypothetical protein